MANLYKPDQGDTPPADDTRMRFPHDRPQRYPIGVRVTVVNGAGASYDCVEVNAAGTDLTPTTTHLAVNNIGDATLEVNDRVPMYCDVTSRSFFLAKRDEGAGATWPYLIRIRMFIIHNDWNGGAEGEPFAAWDINELWDDRLQEFGEGAPGIAQNLCQNYISNSGVQSTGTSTITNLIESSAQCDFDFVASGNEDSVVTQTAFGGSPVRDFLDVSTDETFSHEAEVTYGQSLTRTDDGVGMGHLLSYCYIAFGADIDTETTAVKMESSIYMKSIDGPDSGTEYTIGARLFVAGDIVRTWGTGYMGTGGTESMSCRVALEYHTR